MLSFAIIRYEDIIASRGQVLQCISPSAAQLNEQLVNMNNNNLYNKQLMRLLRERLLQSDGAYWNFYDKQQISKFTEQSL